MRLIDLPKTMYTQALVTSQARLLHHAPKLIAPLMRRLESRFHELSAHGLCAAVWAAAVLNQLSFAAFERANALLDTKSLPEFTSRVRAILSRVQA